MRLWMVWMAAAALLIAQEKEWSLREGIVIEHKGEPLAIKRQIDPACEKGAMSFTPDTLWGGEWASELAPEECKKSFITTFGKVTPMRFHPKVQTVGEVEVVEFIRDHYKDPAFALVDSRMEMWYEQMTIPTAVSVSFLHVSEPEQFGDKHDAALAKLGVTRKGGKYDFSKAKTALFFCNGAWCAQSTIMMGWLIKQGYPPEKMLWYRDGLQGWLQYDLTVVEP
ncbi:MAG: rhodanese-like domain-containing protein [Campylobacterales bacterium]